MNPASKLLHKYIPFMLTVMNQYGLPEHIELIEKYLFHDRLRITHATLEAILAIAKRTGKSKIAPYLETVLPKCYQVLLDCFDELSNYLKILSKLVEYDHPLKADFFLKLYEKIVADPTCHTSKNILKNGLNHFAIALRNTPSKEAIELMKHILTVGKKGVSKEATITLKSYGFTDADLAELLNDLFYQRNSLFQMDIVLMHYRNLQEKYHPSTEELIDLIVWNGEKDGHLYHGIYCLLQAKLNKQTFNRLLDLIKEENLKIRLGAITMFLNCEKPQYLPELANLLQDENERVKRKTIEVIYSILHANKPTAERTYAWLIPMIIAAKKEGKSWWFRYESIRVLDLLLPITPLEAAIEPIVAEITDKEAKMKTTAIRALRHFKKNAVVIEVLEKRLGKVKKESNMVLIRDVLEEVKE